MKNLIISGNTDPGRRRKENEDAWIARQLWTADKALLAVIDGVGGYMGGDKAAAIARDSIEQYMQVPKGDTLTMLREAVIFANNRIVEERQKDQHISEMCCVLTAVVADAAAQTIYFAHVGDTRLYRFREGRLQKLTRDHSFVGIREDAGEMTELEAMHHPHRNQILREVGSATHRLDDEDFMDYGSDDLLPGDQLLLCSDGLTDMITMQQMTTLLSTGQPLTSKVNSLIALANEMGGNDNITVVLLKNKQTAIKKKSNPATPVIPQKGTPLATANPEPAVLNTEHSTPDAQRTTHNSRLSNAPPKILWIILVILLVAAAGWYFSPPGKIAILPSEVIKVDSIRATPASSRVSHPAVPGPVVVEKTDTLRITTTQSWERLKQYADSVGKTVVIIPAKKNNTKFAAISIDNRSAEPGDTLVIKDLRIKDFETGIKVQVPVLLKTENLVFDNIKYPFNNLVKTDSSHTSLLIMNNVKR
ncbi:MAG: serine/threonine-protein phosphatase [Niastella sp.]|nr:serine/threonine-protein phosphatase [Niastella sp.]